MTDQPDDLLTRAMVAFRNAYSVARMASRIGATACGVKSVIELVTEDIKARERSEPVVGPAGTKGDDVPPGYRIAHSPIDGGYWPIFDHGYISNDWYRTQAEAELAAWKHAYTYLAQRMDGIRRMVPTAPGETS